MDLLELFVDVDDFCLSLEEWLAQQQLESGRQRPGAKPRLADSEIMTIMIYFHMSNYRCFKQYYIKHVQEYLREEFPQLVSYTRFVELMPQVMPLLCAYLQSKLGRVTGISFLDSTSIPVCTCSTPSS